MQNAEKVSVSAFTVNTFGRSFKGAKSTARPFRIFRCLVELSRNLHHGGKVGRHGWMEVRSTNKWQQCTPNSSATKKTETAI